MSFPASRLVELTADLVCAYVAGTTVPAGELPDLVDAIHGALARLASGPAEERAGPNARQIARTVTPDYIVSFEDGKPYRTLKRHLRVRGLTPEEYRAKWNLPHDYPITAASYAARRSELAKLTGLGQPHRRTRTAEGG